MISRFFIDRPIFASVVSIVMTLIGGIALFYLPIAQYPRITPPGVSISINYPGASAKVVADTVASPIEQQVNGVPGMLYMSSQMGNDGSYSLTVTFDIGVDLNTALVMVQNRVTLAMPQLPTQVQNQGITIRKRTPDILMIVNFISPDQRYNDIYLSNYATINIRDELLRVPGVSDITYQGERDYSIRIWLDPQELAARDMTALDVATAIRNQNLDAPAGQVGQQPAPQGQVFQLPIDTLGRLTEPEEFANIIVKVSQTTSPAQATGSPRSVVGNIGVPAAPAAATSASRTSSSTATTGTAGGSTLAASSITRGGGASSTATVAPASSMASTTSTTTSAGSTTSTLGVSTTGGGTAAGGGTTTGGSATGGGGSTGGSANGAAPSSTASTSTATDNTNTTGAIEDISINSAAGAGSPGAGSTIGPGQPSLAIVRVRDVGRVELGAQNYNQSCLFDGQPSMGLAVYQLPGTNALDVADRVRAKMEELKKRFPDGIDYSIAYDTTLYISESVSDVVRTLFLAVLLVAVVVLIFLQNWRSVVIPLIAVPVAIISTFAVMKALDFSLNNISLFGLVLAIGIVVDDAIVVVENVERWMARGLDPREATRRAMDEVTGPIIAVALVLCAVFVPCAFVGGITGQFFRQFAVTISVSTVFSAISSLTLSPALAAILLKPHGARRDPVTWLFDVLLGWFFRLFNTLFGISTSAYSWAVERMMRFNVAVLVVYGLLIVITYVVFRSAPVGFVPQQDQGRLICSIQLPDSASLQRTNAALKQVADIARQTPGVAHTVGISGLSFVMQATSPNYASMFIVLKPFAQRRNLPDTAIMANLRHQWTKQVQDAQVTVYGASPVPGLGVAGGFKVMIEDRGDLGLPILQQQTDNVVRKLQQQVPGLVGVTTQFRSKVPQLLLTIDRIKTASLGVSLNDVNQTLEILLGSLYVNSFNEFGRHWQVTVQAAGEFRNRTDDVNLFQVRNNRGQMVPLGTLVQLKEINGPISVTRYNLYQSAAITGNLQPGYSSGAAIQQVDEIAAAELPLSMKADWTELMFMQKRAGNTSMYVFALAVVSVFLALAALYESWSLPLAVILVVPLCLLCSVVGILWTHRDVNIFVQIGLVVLVGLACKNAILIVEFARQLHEEEGRSRFDATEEASRLRLRPILMTSFAFIFGVIPLVVASGAGAEMRRSLGMAVFSGMLGVTLFGVFLTPVFFYVIQGLGESQLLTAERSRWIGSTAAGGVLGLTIGFLSSQLAHFAVEPACFVGATAGILAALAVLEIHRRIRTQNASGS
ncbi:MAG TPA: efflux RND transporter permease subunit [Pirellulales bacterium]|jgi:multidrug efflux pump|nr:efflux RND transporter permease subunit [Pirellulales bacterium]